MQILFSQVVTFADRALSLYMVENGGARNLPHWYLDFHYDKKMKLGTVITLDERRQYEKWFLVNMLMTSSINFLSKFQLYNISGSWKNGMYLFFPVKLQVALNEWGFTNAQMHRNSRLDMTECFNRSFIDAAKI